MLRLCRRAGIVALFCVTSAQASLLPPEAGAPSLPIWNSENLSWDINWHLNNGNTKELVYFDGIRVSELHWPTQAAFMLDHQLTYTFNNGMPLYFSYSHLLYADVGTMQDWDWDESGLIEVAYSHSQAHLKSNDEYNLWTQTPALLSHTFTHGKSYMDLTAKVLGGYRYHSTAWASMGGEQVDNEDGLGQPGDQFFYMQDHIEGIRFTRQSHLLLLGGLLDLDMENAGIQFSAAVSPWSYQSNGDYHNYRGLFFIDYIDHARYYELGFAAHYKVAKNLLIGMNYSYERFLNKKGDTLVHDLLDLDIFLAGDAGGMNSHLHTVRLGFRHLF